jgi:hypothetical protein
MKKTVSLLAFIIILKLGAFAQNFPYGINYQAVARDANGNAQVIQPVTIRFSIYKTTSTGVLVWQETNSATTNSMGQFNLVIGSGTTTGGGSAATFNAIDWAADIHFLKVELNVAGNYQAMGPTTQFQSVPYSMLSAKVIEKQNLTLTDSTLALSGSTPPSVTIDPSSTNELPAAGNGISVIGNTVSVKSVNDYAFYREKYPNATDVPSISGYNTRNINDDVIVSGSAISRSGSFISLQPGTYLVRAKSFNYLTGDCKLYFENTSGTNKIIGIADAQGASSPSTSTIGLDGVIVVTTADSFSLRHYCTSARSNGLGASSLPNDPNDIEVYSTILIQKIN